MGLLIDCKETLIAREKSLGLCKQTEAYKDRKDIFLENRRKGASSFIFKKEQIVYSTYYSSILVYEMTMLHLEVEDSSLLNKVARPLAKLK